ncbi:MAG: DUF2933 domain-containing protein [Sporichthyaceae bacterium]
MNKNRYPLYGVAIVAGAALAIWAGLSPFFLLFLLVCPLMMFFMMRGMGGMGGGMHGDSRRGDHEDSVAPESKTPRESADSRHRSPGGAHEHTGGP